MKINAHFDLHSKLTAPSSSTKSSKLSNLDEKVDKKKRILDSGDASLIVSSMSQMFIFTKETKALITEVMAEAIPPPAISARNVPKLSIQGVDAAKRGISCLDIAEGKALNADL